MGQRDNKQYEDPLAWYFVFLEENVGSDHDIPAAGSVIRQGWIDTGGVKGPARYRAVSDRVVALEHRNLGGLLRGKPVPVVVGAIGEACGLADTVVVDTIVGDVWLVSERGPGAEHEGVLAHSLHRLGEVDRHEPPRHLRVGLFLRIVLLASEVPKVLREQLTTAYPAAIIVQVIVHEVGVTGVYTWDLVVLVFLAVALVVLVKHIVVVHKRICRTREILQEEFLHLRVEHSLYLLRVIEVLTLGLTVCQRDPELIHALRTVWREAWLILLHSSRVPQHLWKIETSSPLIAFFFA